MRIKDDFPEIAETTPFPLRLLSRNYFNTSGNTKVFWCFQRVWHRNTCQKWVVPFLTKRLCFFFLIPNENIRKPLILWTKYFWVLLNFSGTLNPSSGGLKSFDISNFIAQINAAEIIFQLRVLWTYFFLSFIQSLLKYSVIKSRVFWCFHMGSKKKEKKTCNCEIFKNIYLNNISERLLL